MRWLLEHILKWLGWEIMGELPQGLHKAVLVVAPHTSNWDFFYGMSSIFVKKLPAKFAIKKEFMFFPLGLILKWIGAIPIDRNRYPTSVQKPSQVAMLIDLLIEREKLFLIIAPEGTRKYVSRWKTGFYYIAINAKVPIVLGYLDYAKKKVGLGPVFYPTGDIIEDTKKIQAFYQDKTAKYPEQGVY